MEEAGAGDAIDKETFFLEPAGVIDGAYVACVLRRGLEWRDGFLFGFGDDLCVQTGRAVDVEFEFAVCVGHGVAGCQIGIDGGEGGEVVGAEDVGGCLLEEFWIEIERAGPDVGGKHGRADVRGVFTEGEDSVFIGLSAGAMTRVEVGGDDFEREDANAGREGPVEGAVEIEGGDRDGEGEGRYLSESMNAGVGASGALGKHGFSRNMADGVGEGALDGGQIRLNLPAVVGGSVVGENGLPMRHEDDLHGITGAFLFAESG